MVALSGCSDSATNGPELGWHGCAKCPDDLPQRPEITFPEKVVPYSDNDPIVSSRGSYIAYRLSYGSSYYVQNLKTGDRFLLTSDAILQPGHRVNEVGTNVQAWCPYDETKMLVGTGYNYKDSSGRDTSGHVYWIFDVASRSAIPIRRSLRGRLPKRGGGSAWSQYTWLAASKINDDRFKVSNPTNAKMNNLVWHYQKDELETLATEPDVYRVTSSTGNEFAFNVSEYNQTSWTVNGKHVHLKRALGAFGRASWSPNGRYLLVEADGTLSFTSGACEAPRVIIYDAFANSYAMPQWIIQRRAKFCEKSGAWTQSAFLTDSTLTYQIRVEDDYEALFEVRFDGSIVRQITRRPGVP